MHEPPLSPTHSPKKTVNACTVLHTGLRKHHICQLILAAMGHTRSNLTCLLASVIYAVISWFQTTVRDMEGGVARLGNRILDEKIVLFNWRKSSGNLVRFKKSKQRSGRTNRVCQCAESLRMHCSQGSSHFFGHEWFTK